MDGRPERAGAAYAFNILGCIVGPLIAGFWLEPWLGERWATLALALPLFGIAAIITFQRASQPEHSAFPIFKVGKAILVCGIATCIFILCDDYATIFPKREVLRDYAATVIATGTGQKRLLLVNGTGMTTLTPITKYIAHLPLAFMS